MKQKLRFWLRRCFSLKQGIADLHQACLLTAIGGWIAMFFSETGITFKSIAITIALFLVGVFLGNLEKGDNDGSRH